MTKKYREYIDNLEDIDYMLEELLKNNNEVSSSIQNYHQNHEEDHIDDGTINYLSLIVGHLSSVHVLLEESLRRLRVNIRDL
jgi:hypothetical protein